MILRGKSSSSNLLATFSCKFSEISIQYWFCLFQERRRDEFVPREKHQKTQDQFSSKKGKRSRKETEELQKYQAKKKKYSTESSSEESEYERKKSKKSKEISRGSKFPKDVKRHSRKEKKSKAYSSEESSDEKHHNKSKRHKLKKKYWEYYLDIRPVEEMFPVLDYIVKCI